MNSYHYRTPNKTHNSSIFFGKILTFEWNKLLLLWTLTITYLRTLFQSWLTLLPPNPAFAFRDTHLIQTPHYHGLFALSLGKESPYIFSKFKPLNKDTPLIWIFSMASSVPLLTWFESINENSSHNKHQVLSFHILKQLKHVSSFLSSFLSYWLDFVFFL